MYLEPATQDYSVHTRQWVVAFLSNRPDEQLLRLRLKRFAETEFTEFLVDDDVVVMLVHVVAIRPQIRVEQASRVSV